MEHRVKMSQPESKGYGWKAWRINRLLEILDYKAQGFSDAEVAEAMPISRSTVSRELNSQQAIEIGRALRMRAEGLVWSLIETQLKQIETDDLTPGQKLIYRGKLINTLASLVPKQIEQRLQAMGDLRFVLEAWRPDTEEDSKESGGDGEPEEM